MAEHPIHARHTPAVPPHETPQAQRASLSKQIAENIYLAQVEGEEGLAEALEGAIFNPFAMSRRFESLETRIRRTGKEEEADKKEKSEQKKLQQVQKIGEVAEDFSRRTNQELNSRTLVLLRQRITKEDSAEDVIRKVLEFYTDFSLADEAIDFLIETADDPEIAKTLQQAKAQFNTSFGREIKAGRNISEQARAFSEQGLGSPTALRDMYREITGTARDPNTLFEQLSSNFGYEKMKKVIDFMLHALGSDLKSQGPSIARGQLHRLMTETRVLQAILGVYRFFRSRMKLMESSFSRYGLIFPSRISFESLAKQYMRYLQERYPSPEKVLAMALLFGIEEEEIAQMIVFTQLRDACRQIAPRLFKSEQHRQDTLRSFMEALEQIEEEIEKEEEEEEKKEGKKKKKEETKKLK
jgi:type III secretion protein W